MTDNLKIDVVLADVGESGVALSNYVTKDVHTQDLSEKADLVGGKVKADQLPAFSELNGVTAAFSGLETTLRSETDAALVEAKVYADGIVSNAMLTKADLVSGRVPADQATEFKDVPGAKGVIDGLKQSFQLSIQSVQNELRENYPRLENNKIARINIPNDILMYSEDLTQIRNELQSGYEAFVVNSDERYAGKLVETEVDKIIKNGASLPYNPSIQYLEGSIVRKDGELKQLIDGEWVSSLVASSIKTKSSQTQQDINDKGGATWYAKSGGYNLNDRVILNNGDIVRSTVAKNTVDPNADMTGWVEANAASQITTSGGLNQEETNALKAGKAEVLPQTQTKDSFKNAYSSKKTNRFNQTKDKCSVGRSYVWKNPKHSGDAAYKFSVGLNMNGYKTIEWEFVADADDFYRMRYGFTGAIRPPTINVDATNISQAPIRSLDNAYFRSSDGLNATFDVVFTGTGFLFNHRVDEFGGIFEVRVDGLLRGAVSCHINNPENSGAASSNISKLIAANLSSGSHTANFKFIGNDPNYAPTGGASRGWFKLSDGVSPEIYTASIISGTEMGIADTGALLVSNAILEFAIGAAPTGTSLTPDWVPAHGSASGCIIVSERKFFIDGIEYIGFPSTELQFNEFTMKQAYTAYNSGDTTKAYPMWSGVLYTKFDKNRGLTYSHEFTTLRELLFSDGYTAMASGRRTSDLNKITFDNGEIIDISGATPSVAVDRYPGVFKSVAWEGFKTALALNIESIEASSAIGTIYNDGKASLSTERTDGFCKVYAKPLGKNKVVPANVTITSTHNIWLATI